MTYDKKIEMRQKTKNYCRRRWGPHNLSEEKQMDKKIAYEKIFIVRVQKQDRYCKI